MANTHDRFGPAVSNTNQTLTLTGTLVEVVRVPIASALQRRSDAQALRAWVGQWAGEAFDKNGKCRIPVLRATKFEQHLINEDGQFKSEEECEAHAPWARLIHAIGIRPGMGILDWRPATEDFVALGHEKLQMEVDGEVICHLVNLYRENAAPDPRSRHQTVENSGAETVYQLCFGRIELKLADGKVQIKFFPGSLEQLSTPIIPFQCKGESVAGRTLVATYFNALHQGVSSQALLWPTSNAPLKERVDALIQHARSVKNHNNGVLLLTQDWLEEASRIKRRVTSAGGANRRFVEDTLKRSRDLPWWLPWWLPSWVLGFPRDRYGITEGTVRDLFMFSGQKFDAKVRSYHSQGGLHSGHFFILQGAEQALEKYRNLPATSWERQIFELQDRTRQVLELGNTIYHGDSVRTLDFQPGCPLWNQGVGI